MLSNLSIKSSGLSLRARGWEFSLATTMNVSPSYFHREKMMIEPKEQLLYNFPSYQLH